jgi:acyl-CoA dehydrogenase
VSSVELAHDIAWDVAARFADSVDRDARFPVESMAALKEAKLLSLMVPRALGGAGATVRDVGEICHELAQCCASTAMVYAMHQIQVACVVRHGMSSCWCREFLGRLAADQLLIASATSEAGSGGDIRRSVCAVDMSDDRFTLKKHATVVSYADHADAILVTARRTPASPSSDQVAAVVLKNDYRLDQTGGWDSLGMRGTCSNAYWLEASGVAGQILAAPFADISAETMLPTSHLAWSSLWLGIATDAVSRARAFVRDEARKTPGDVPPGALRLADVVGLHRQMKDTVVAGFGRYQESLDSAATLTSLSFAIAMNSLKTSTSQLVVQVVNNCMLICGIHGYKNDTRFSLGRHLRDAHSAAVMVSNDRILGNTANLLLVHKDDPTLFG